VKKKNIIALIVIACGIAIISMLLPWWTSVIWIIVICIIMNTSLRAGWWISGIGLAIVWLVASLYFKTQDQTDLIGRTGTLLGGISGSLLVVVTIILGFISGALAGWFGSVCALLLNEKKNPKAINGYTRT
jgi:hypothetical protein